MNRTRSLLTAFVLALVSLGIVLPAAGASAAGLDPAFGRDGVLVEPGFGDQRIAQDPRGRIVAVVGSGDGFTVARYLPGGDPDWSFGANGIAELDLPRSELAQVSAIRVQPDGKILIAGLYRPETEIGVDQVIGVLARLGPDGSIDGDFGAGLASQPVMPGVVRTKAIRAILVSGDRIWVGGEEGRGYVGRFEMDGGRDVGFQDGGWLELPPREPGPGVYPRNGFTGVTGLIAGRAGSVYATGYAKGKLMLAEIGADGRPRGGFGNGGVVRTPLPGAPSCPCVVTGGAARDARGRLLLVGTISRAGGKGRRQYPTGPRRIVLARYLPNGRLDRRFGGGDGLRYASAGRSGYGEAVAALPGGRIVVAGWAKIGSDANDAASRFAVFRFLADGRPDRSFFGDGVYASRFGAVSGWANQVLVRPSGGILVAGGAAFAPRHANLRGVIAAFAG